MNQQLQILNSSLISLALFVGSIYFFCLQPAPKVNLRRVAALEAVDNKIVKPAIVPDFIYQNDLFGTFNVSLPSVQTNKQIPSVPQFSFKPIQSAPVLKAPEMMQPLTLILNGIVLASAADKSIAIISDETSKENIFYVGDQIKDAFIAKILKESIVLFRSNGQQEVFFLRKEDEALKKMKQDDGWTSCVVNIAPNQYQVDANKWMQKVPSLGTFFELCHMVPALKSGDEYAGLFISEQESTDLVKALGLQSKDLIVSINQIELNNKKKMLKAYDEVVKTKEEGTIELQVMRQKTPLKITYVRREIESQMPVSLLGSQGQSSPSPEAAKEIEKKKIEQAPFVRPEPRLAKAIQKKAVEDDESSDYYDTIMKIRKRLVDNMNQRSPYTHRR